MPLPQAFALVRTPHLIVTGQQPLVAALNKAFAQDDSRQGASETHAVYMGPAIALNADGGLCRRLVNKLPSLPYAPAACPVP